MISKAIKIQRSDENGHSSSPGRKTLCVWSSCSWENNSEEFPHTGILNFQKRQIGPVFDILCVGGML